MLPIYIWWLSLLLLVEINLLKAYFFAQLTSTVSTVITLCKLLLDVSFVLSIAVDN